MRNIGGSIGIAGVAAFLARWTQVRQATLITHLTPYDPAYQRWLSTAQSGLAARVGALAAGPKSVGLPYNVLGQQARLLAFLDIFRVVSIVALVAAPLVLLFKRTLTRQAPAAH